MSTLGIIVEYNPFHNGHLHHLEEAKKITNATTTIAVMSGSFLQRGEPALVDKWTRTKMALANGVDLVIELPIIYSTQSADWFAFGSTFLLNSLFVDNFVFGSETNSLKLLDQVADLLLNEPLKFRNYIKEELSLGHSYPKALSLSLIKHLGSKEYTVSKPNDILGIQYLLNLKRLKSPIIAQTIQRKNAEYNDNTLNKSSIASATAIRSTFLQEKNLQKISTVIPESTLALLDQEFKQNRINLWENYLHTLQIIGLSKDKSQLQKIHGMVEGIESRIQEKLLNCRSFSQLLELLKTKRYTSAKIQRTLLYLLLNLTKEKVEKINPANGPQYIRILGFNQLGREYLNRIKHQLDLPLITKIPRDKPAMLELDLKAAAIYELGFKEPAFIKEEYKQAPMYWK